jgi:hypothetical protein
MKKILPIIAMLALITNITAQDIPSGFNYQAILRDAANNIIADKLIDLELSIQDAIGTDIWIETHSVTTNQFGLVSLVVGQGTRTGGTVDNFGDIDWGAGTKKLHTEITYNSQEIDMGTSEIWSIPYSMVSKNAYSAQNAVSAQSAVTAQSATNAQNAVTAQSATTAQSANVAYDLAGDLSKLNVVEDVSGVGTEPLFEVKNNTGQTVFAVYNEGVEVYVNDTGTKGEKGGFAVKGFGDGKAGEANYLLINGDSARIYINSDPVKGGKGGFAVGSFSETGTKAAGEEYLRITRDSARIYINTDETTKSEKGGFAVGSFSEPGTKSAGEEYLRITRDSTRIYINDAEEGSKGDKGSFAVKGFETGKSDISSYFDINLNSTNLLVNPAENRILWYPYRNAFLAGRILIEDSASVGVNSFVSGYESRAKGNYSQAMGYKAYADGLNSTSIGQNSLAGGDNSYAFGQNAKALATESYAIGNGALASLAGLNSYAIGSGAEAIDTSSYAIGTGAVSSGESSVAIGTYALADGDYSYAFGIDAYTGPLGNHSFAIGQQTSALGVSSYAIGYRSMTDAESSFALGQDARAKGKESYAIGKGAYAVADESYAIGRGAISNGIGSFAFGSAGLDSAGNITQVVTSSGAYSIAIGQGAQTLAEGGVAIGISTTSSGKFATSMGYETTSSGYSSFTSGSKTNASADYSSAMGYFSIASGLGSTAIGLRNYATANYSFAAGNGNRAEGSGSAALGTFSIASGGSSLALGTHVEAFSYGETALGMYNTSYTPNETEYPGNINDRLLVLGNGTKDTPSDALVIMKNGESYFNGNINPVTDNIYSLGTSAKRWKVVYSTDGVLNTSDARYKTDIENIENSLDKIMRINGVRYDWNTVGYPEMNFDNKTHIGVLAQEVEEVLPELVYTDENGYKSVSYEKLTPVLIEAVKEQQSEIDSQNSEIMAQREKLNAQQDEMTTLKAENEELKARIAIIESMLDL